MSKNVSKLERGLEPDNVFREREVFGDFPRPGVNRFVVFRECVGARFQFDTVGKINLKRGKRKYCRHFFKRLLGVGSEPGSSRFHLFSNFSPLYR
jgi:hypothetical protein